MKSVLRSFAFPLLFVFLAPSCSDSDIANEKLAETGMFDQENETEAIDEIDISISDEKELQYFIACSYQECAGMSCALLDETGNQKIPSGSYEFLHGSSEGYISVRDNNWNVGYVDFTGDQVIGYEYQMGYEFTQGLAAVQKNNLYGYINPENQVIIDFQYLYASPFTTNNTAIVTSTDYQYGLIDNTGTYIIPLEYSELSYFDFEKTKILATGSDGFVLFDIDGTIINHIYADIVTHLTPDQLAGYYQDGLWGFVDQTGTKVIEPTFDTYGWQQIYTTNREPSNRIPIGLDSKFGYVDATGKTVLNFVFSDALPYADNGLAAVQMDGYYGYIDTSGKTVIDFTYTQASQFDENGIAIVYKNNSCYAINEKGTVVFGDYQSIWGDTHGYYIIVNKDGNSGVADSFGKLVIPFEYKFIQPLFYEDGWN